MPIRPPPVGRAGEAGHISVIGGSTPFTAALADAIVARGEAIPPQPLILHGRDAANLEAVGRYVFNRLSPLGWTVDWTTDMRAALRGARIVVHQPRYGGNIGRQRDEELALAYDIVPDETLGPAALQSALRLRSMLAESCRLIVEACPEAWVLNLVNPLSITTTRMVQAGVKRCIGVCELPRVTMRKAAAVLDRDPERAEWAYTGLNHRGFITRLAWNGKNRIDEVSGLLGEAALDGISAAEIANLEAVPTKYFRLLSDRPGPARGGRAAFLERLRNRLLEELRSDPVRSPPSLKERYLAWYPEAVVPLLEALSTSEPVLLELNKLTGRGVVEEGRAAVSAAGVGDFVEAPIPIPVQTWLNRFIRHEQLLLNAVERPCIDTLRGALQADPLVPSCKVEDCAQNILAGLDREAAERREHVRQAR